MKLITRFELVAKPLKDLHALRREVFNVLARSARGSIERRNAIASLDNLDAELASRTISP
jgi:hypothetical protein